MAELFSHGVEVGRFVDGLKSAGVEFFTGVPDSLLKSFCEYVTDTCGGKHVITINSCLFLSHRMPCVECEACG